MYRGKEIVLAYNRAVALLESLNRRRRRERWRPRRPLSVASGNPDHEATHQYNVLRNDVKKLVADSNFNRVVPPFWNLAFVLDFLGPVPVATSGVLIILAVAGVVLVTKPFEGATVPDWFFLFPPLLIPIAVIVFIDFSLTGSIDQIYERTKALERYLRDHISFEYPNLARQIWPSKYYAQTLENRIDQLEAMNYALEEELEEAHRQIDSLKHRLAGLETPSQYEADEQVLEKLDPLERSRLLEAVQAYRVNAWTPAAAVCGMILEGRLQKLCRQNNIPTGGLGAMIRRLGEADLLKGYYQQLVKVGEFFRHRATHPTSEEFDRDKTTLVLTSLIILIRDLF